MIRQINPRVRASSSSSVRRSAFPPPRLSTFRIAFACWDFIHWLKCLVNALLDADVYLDIFVRRACLIPWNNSESVKFSRPFCNDVARGLSRYSGMGRHP